MAAQIIGSASRHLRKEISNHLKLIFTASDKKTARKLAKELSVEYEKKLVELWIV